MKPSPSNETKPAIENDVRYGGVLQELIDLIGYQDALRMVRYFGGMDIYIPKNPKRSRLSDSSYQLTEQALQTLSINYGGTYLNVPSARQYEIKERNKLIFEELKAGHSRSEVARRHNLGVRQIANIKREMSYQTQN